MTRRGWQRLLRLGRPDPETEIGEAIETHLAMQTADLVAEGWTPEAAREEALRRFGDRRRAERETLAVDRKRENAVRRRERARDIAHEARLAWRQLWRRPVFALVAVAVIALGIGANSAVFAVVDGALLRPLPFPDGDRLVVLWERMGPDGNIGASFPEFRDWEREADFLEGIVAIYGTGVRFRTGEGWDLLPAARIAGDPRPTFGYEPVCPHVRAPAGRFPDTPARTARRAGPALPSCEGTRRTIPGHFHPIYCDHDGRGESHLSKVAVSVKRDVASGVHASGAGHSRSNTAPRDREHE